MNVFEAFAQEQLPEKGVRVIARMQEGKVLLRWGVTTPSLWLKANTYGYHIERFTVAQDGVLLSTPEKKRLTTTPLQPVPLQDWEALVDRDDYAAILAQALYGENFEVEGMQEEGAIAAIVNKSQEIEQRFSFAFFAADMSFEGAQLAALGYEDTTIQQGAEYLYRVTAAIPSEIAAVSPGTVAITIGQSQVLPAPIDVMAVPDDRTVLLSWDYEMFRAVYNSYYVEKSEDGTNFIRLGTEPLVNLNSASENAVQRMQYVDTLSQNDKTYYYRIKGRTPFGEESTPSKMVSAMGVKKLEATPQFTKKTLGTAGDVALEWEFLTTAEKQIEGFALHWAPQESGPYKVVQSNIPAQARKTTYTQLLPSNYFKITALGKNRQKNTSIAAFVQTIDSIPPAAPVGLTGVIDTLGVVRIQWQANTENDLRGYRVFRGNLEGEQLSQITKKTIEKITFQDTVQLKSLNKNVFYQVVAVDQRHNNSAYSQKLVLEKPDVIPPTSPVFSEYKSKKEGIFVQWVNSSSTDVATHQLYRQHTETPEKGWELVFKTSSEISFLDSKVVPMQKYRYAIFAQDKAQLLSEPSTPITVVAQNTEQKNEVIKGLTVIADRANSKVSLHWRKMPLDVVEVLIYKSKKEEKPVLWKQLSGTINAIDDNTVSPNNTYVYQLKAMTTDGIHSRLITKEITY